MSRLADEAAYFGAVADGVESQQEEIAELRQQLADLNRICEFDQKTNEQLLEQRDQLRKQVTLLRNQVLEECAAVAEDTAAGRDAEAIADAIRAMKYKSG